MQISQLVAVDGISWNKWHEEYRSMKNKNNGYVASQGLRDTDLKQLIVVRGVWEEILSWVVPDYVPCPKGKKYTVTGIIFSLVKDALWMAMICDQLKIHQKNWENMSLVFNRCLVYVRSEQQWQHRLPLGVTQLNTNIPSMHVQELPSAALKPPLGFPIFCVPTHLPREKARDAPRSSAGTPLLLKLTQFSVSWRGGFTFSKSIHFFIC